ncbi:hypothetical protein [Microbacterium sp. NPDC076911]|uniref:hypothetical protein n=1 Tax=Microbacterium sp. NPDC076911 TaxID=3154958 RepID=UPI00342FAE97
MIFAALSLLAVGTADLVRRFVSVKRRWIGYALLALLTIVLGAGVDGGVAAFIAISAAALWLLTMPADGTSRSGFWPVAALAVLCTTAIAAFAPRSGVGYFADLFIASGAFEGVGVDLALLIAGVGVFLLESSNVIVRTALRSENAVSVETHTVAPSGATPTLKGGRLIGPLERILVFALTLAGAYTLLAAVLAAKGIVRFPEISRDTDTGGRAEYFLVGSLVSWVIALACAGLVWWGSGIALV